MLLNFAKEDNVKEKIGRGDFSNLQEYSRQQIGLPNAKRDENFLAGLIDTASTNPVWADKFQKSFSKTYGSKINIQSFSEDEKKEMANYTITGGVAGTDISGLFETTILPVLDGLLFDNSPILSRVSQIPVGTNDGNQTFKLNEFSGEQTAESLDEDDEGTEADDTTRAGDSILPDNKIQASTSFTEYALLTMRPELMGNYTARLLKRIENRYVNHILAGSNASNQFKGIINSSGAGEDDQEGALAFAYGASGASDNLDYLLRSVGDLPNAVTEGEESRFVFIGRRTDFYSKLAIVQNATNDYKRVGVIDAMPGSRTVGGVPFLFAGNGLSANQVLLVDLANYYVARKGGLRLITDDGKSNVKKGNVTFVAREYADGGMVFAHKNAVGSGAGANDNQARNMFRLLTLT